MREFLDKCADAGLKQIELLDQAVGKYVDILSVAHDLGDNRGVTIGAGLWREIYKDAYRKYFRGWRKRTNMRVNLHSCGSVAEILPDLIECGLEVLNPVQTSGAGQVCSPPAARWAADAFSTVDFGWLGYYLPGKVKKKAAFLSHNNFGDVTAGSTPEQIDLIVRAAFENNAPISIHPSR